MHGVLADDIWSVKFSMLFFVVCNVKKVTVWYLHSAGISSERELCCSQRFSHWALFDGDRSGNGFPSV